MKSGCYQLSMQEYLDAPGLAHHTLAPMRQSPAHFKAALVAEEEETDALKLGNIIHTAVFEPRLLEVAYWLRPETYTNKKGETKKWNGNAGECKDWLAAHEDRHVIRQSEHETVIGVRKAVFEHTAARRALSEGSPEQSLFVEDPEYHVQLKHRPDWMSGNTLVNLKTCLDASKEGFAKSVATFGYDSAAAFHLDVANFLNLGKDFYLFIAVEKEPPYAVGVYQLDDESIEVGRRKYRRWLALYDHCQRMSEWPGYSEDIELLKLPDWEIRRENRLLLAS